MNIAFRFFIGRARACGMPFFRALLVFFLMKSACLLGFFNINRAVIKNNTNNVRNGKQDCKNCMLKNADFTGVDLSGKNFSGADLSGANLSGANLANANFEKADLRNANLSGVKLAQTSFHFANLSGANLAGAQTVSNAGNNFQDANLENAHLEKADLTNAYMPGAYFKNADLTYAVLVGAELYKANFVDAKLKNVNFTGAKLRETVLAGAQMPGANFAGQNLIAIQLYGANLEGADFSGANMESAGLNGAKLTKANLRNTYLANAYFANADLSGADLSGADLFKADLRNVNMSGAILHDTVLVGARITDPAALAEQKRVDDRVNMILNGVNITDQDVLKSLSGEVVWGNSLMERATARTKEIIYDRTKNRWDLPFWSQAPDNHVFGDLSHCRTLNKSNSPEAACANWCPAGQFYDATCSEGKAYCRCVPRTGDQPADRSGKSADSFCAGGYCSVKIRDKQ
jgi:uncharacterized protein YjbI with pentapeptide repeats